MRNLVLDMAVGRDSEGTGFWERHWVKTGRALLLDGVGDMRHVACN